MELKEGSFYASLINLMSSPSPDVRYNSAGIIGHLAMNGNCTHACLHARKRGISQHTT